MAGDTSGQAGGREQRLREALEAARHALTTLHGLTASDGVGEYAEALAEGCDHAGAWDCFVDETWRIDEAATLALIDKALETPTCHD